MYVPIDELPDSANLWAYAFNRELTDTEIDKVAQMLDTFVSGWASHEVPVDGSYKIVDGRFVVLAGHCSDGVSGCSTDSSIRTIKAIETEIGVNAFDRMLVFFRDGSGSVVAVRRPDFQELVLEGHVADDTVVFDTTITSVADLRAGRFETTYAESWHARAFRRTPA